MLMFKKILIGLLLFFVGLIVLIVLAANSSFVIKKVADKFAPEYKISYDDIAGNIFTGVRIEGLKFEDKSLAKHISFAWNPSKILYKVLYISEISAKDVEVDAVKALIASFPESEDNSSSAFPLNVLVSKVHIGVNPFDESNIHFSKILLNVEDVHYSSSALGIEALSLNVDSNITKLDLNASLDNNTVTIDNLRVQDLDTLALQALFPSENNEINNQTQRPANDNNTSVVVSKISSTNDEFEESNSLMPTQIVLKSVHAEILPAKYAPLEILDFAFNAKELLFDVESLVLKKGHVSFEGNTNLSQIKHEGTIVDNTLIGDINLHPSQALFTLYDLPLNAESFSNLKIHLSASEENILTTITAKAKEILIVSPDLNQTDSNNSETNATKAFNVDIDDFTANIAYSITNNTLHAVSKLLVSTPYAKNVSLTNTFDMNDSISYFGALKVKKIIGMDENLTRALKHFTIDYSGDLEHLKTKIDSEGLKGSFNSSDMKKATFYLATKKDLVLKKMFTLPVELNASEVGFVIDIPINFEKPLPMTANIDIKSNIAHTNIKLNYGDTTTLDVKTVVPKDSLLKQFNKEVQWQSISPLNIHLEVKDEDFEFLVESSKIHADFALKPSEKSVKGKFYFSGLKSTLHGKMGEDIVLESDVGSFKSLLASVNQFYRVEGLPDMEGKLNLSLVFTKENNTELHLFSPKIIYHADRKTDHDIEDINVVLSTTKKGLILKSYKLTYNKLKLFATKPSIINASKTSLLINELWLNDQLKVTGTYNVKKAKGEILANASTFHLEHELIDLDAAIDIKTVLNEDHTNIKGLLTLLGGNVHYDLDTKTFPSDSDILIVQDIKIKEPNPFMDNMTANILVKTKKPLLYKEGPIDVQAKLEVTIDKKKNSDFLVLGSLEILEGGSYTFQDKRFVLAKSFVHFTGDPSKPLLDITVKYKTPNHKITILVTGTAAAPNINFSSVPSLNKQQILSVILFDSEASSGNADAEDMMMMMGGLVAKSALSDFGIKLDHLVLGTGGSVEVGKKISDKFTVIYAKDRFSSVRLEYAHSGHTKSVLSASERSESYDIIYRNDYTDEDMIFFGTKKK